MPQLLRSILINLSSCIFNFVKPYLKRLNSFRRCFLSKGALTESSGEYIHKKICILFFRNFIHLQKLLVFLLKTMLPRQSSRLYISKNFTHIRRTNSEKGSKKISIFLYNFRPFLLWKFTQ